VDDLEPVFILKRRRIPIAAAHHDAIQLDRNARGRQLELGD